MPRASRSSLAEALDFVSDWGVLAFASWTLIAYVGMATEARVSVLVSVWLATVPLLGAIRAVLARRSSGNPTPEPPAEPRTTPLPVAPAPGYRRHLWIAGLGAGVASALIAAASQKAPWLLVWAGTLAAVAVAVGFGRLRVGETACPRPTFGWRAHAFVATVGLGFAIMSLFLRRENLDDAFYVNRATGTSQLNRIPVRDIIFTDEKVPALSGTGLPVDSFSALQGAIGRFIDVHPASVAYYLTPPLFTFLATWALWRLLRLWAPRNAVLCFALGCTYWVFSAQGGMSAGSFFLNRMWQGKVIFVAWLVLTTYVFLTRWLERRDAVTAVLLLAAGVCSIGMTASAAFVVPLLMGAAVLPLLACRDWRGLPVVIAAAGIPLVIGLVVTLEHPLVQPLNIGHERAHLYDRTSWYFHEVFGIGLVAAVGLIGLWAAPWLARSGPPARLTTGVAVVMTVVLIPALLPTVNDVIGLSTVLRRTMWIVPFPALVGLIAAVPAARLLGRFARAPTLPSRVADALPALLVAAALVAFGHPLWDSFRAGESLWVKRPTWKTDPGPLRTARAILRRYDGSEPVLAHARIMYAMSLLTVSPKAVNPRSFYAYFLSEPTERTRNRLALTRLVSGQAPTPSPQRVQTALSDLRVGLACVPVSNPSAVREIERMGYQESFRVPRQVCLRRRDS